MSLPARRVLVPAVVVLLLLGGVVFLIVRVGSLVHPPPGCTVALGAGSDDVSDYPLSPEQADNEATVAAVGNTLGMSQRAVTVALVTALQESGLHNLRHGDRDSVGLFQQRPSQGWGTADQIADPVYAARAFYRRLDEQPNWTGLDVNDAAQHVQHSAAPDAYGRWTDEAGAIAAALTGAPGASLSCHDLRLGLPESSLVTVAKRELGTAALSGAHPPDRGRQIGNWLVAHAVRFGIERVTYDGSTWTAESGRWTRTGNPDGLLSLRQVGSSTS